MFQRIQQQIALLPALNNETEWKKLSEEAKLIGQIKNITDPRTQAIFQHELEFRKANIKFTKHLEIFAELQKIENKITEVWVKLKDDKNLSHRMLEAESVQSLIIDLLPAELEFLNKLHLMLEQLENEVFSYKDVENASLMNMKISVERKKEKLKAEDRMLEILKEKNANELRKILELIRVDSADEKQIPFTEDPGLIDRLRQTYEIFLNKDQATYLVLCQELESILESFINLLSSEIRDKFFPDLSIDVVKASLVSKQSIEHENKPDLQVAIKHFDRFVILQNLLKNSNKNPLERLQAFVKVFKEKNPKPYKNPLFSKAEKAVHDHMKKNLKIYPAIFDKKKFIDQLAKKFKNKSKETEQHHPADQKSFRK